MRAKNKERTIKMKMRKEGQGIMKRKSKGRGKQ